MSSNSPARTQARLALALALASVVWNGGTVFGVAGSGTALLFGGAAFALVVFGWVAMPDAENALKASIGERARAISTWATPGRRSTLVVLGSVAVVIVTTRFGTLLIREIPVTCNGANDLHWEALQPESKDCDQGQGFRYWAALKAPRVRCGYLGRGEWRDAELTEERLVCPPFIPPIAVTNLETSSKGGAWGAPSENAGPRVGPGDASRNEAIARVGREDPAAVSGAELQARFYRSTFPSPPPGAFVLDLLYYDGHLGILSFRMRAPGGKYGLSRVALEIRGVARCPLRDEKPGGGAAPEWRYEFALSREFSSYEIIPLDEPGAPARFEYDPNGHQHDDIQVFMTAPNYELFLVSVVVDGWAFSDSRREPFAVESPVIPVIFLPPTPLDRAAPDSVLVDAERGCLDIGRWYSPRLLEPPRQASLRDGLSTLPYQLMTARLSDDDRFTRSVEELGDRAIDRALAEIAAFAERHPQYPEAQNRLLSLEKWLGRAPSADPSAPPAVQKGKGCTDVIPWFMSRELTSQDLSDVDLSTLANMRNEIYARRGRIFKDTRVQERFESECWYQPRYRPDEFPADALSLLEHRNVEKIVAAERERSLARH